MNGLIPIFPHFQPFLGYLDAWALGETNKTWLKVLTRSNPMCTAHEVYYEIFYPMIVVKDPTHGNRSKHWTWPWTLSINIYWSNNGEQVNRWLTTFVDWPHFRGVHSFIILNNNTMQWYDDSSHSIISLPRTREKWQHFFQQLNNGHPMGILVHNHHMNTEKT